MNNIKRNTNEWKKVMKKEKALAAFQYAANKIMSMKDDLELKILCEKFPLTIITNDGLRIPVQNELLNKDAFPHIYQIYSDICIANEVKYIYIIGMHDDGTEYSLVLIANVKDDENSDLYAAYEYTLEKHEDGSISCTTPYPQITACKTTPLFAFLFDNYPGAGIPQNVIDYL